MKATENSSPDKIKNKKWLFFAAGMLAGILLSILIVFLTGDPFPTERIVFLTPENKETGQENAPDTLEDIVLQKTVVTYIYDTISAPGQDTVIPKKTEEEELLAQFEDVEFTIYPVENEEVVALDKIIATRKIRTVIKYSGEEETINKQSIDIFEVQQWSTPIRNSITYQRNNSNIRIKGLDISKVEIHLYNGDYYLINGSNSYSIPNNDHYERLVEKKPAQF